VRPPTSGPLGAVKPESRLRAGRTLPTGIVIGRKRSQDLRFRRVVRNSDMERFPLSVTAWSGR